MTLSFSQRQQKRYFEGGIIDYPGINVKILTLRLKDHFGSV